MAASQDLLRGTFRLSLVLALLAAILFSYQDWVERDKAHREKLELVTTIECGARAVEMITEEALKLIANSAGLMDLSKVCTAARF
jgi:hypothetical protein